MRGATLPQTPDARDVIRQKALPDYGNVPLGNGAAAPLGESPL